MKIKSILLAVAVCMLSGCFLKVDEKQSHIETADIMGHAICYLSGIKMFDDDFLSARELSNKNVVEIISKDGTVYHTGVENCFITGLKGKRAAELYNYNLH